MTAAAGSPLVGSDRVAFGALEQSLLEARRQGDLRPPFTVVAACLDELGVALPERSGRAVNLEQAREQWLQRLRNAGRSRSTITAYRVAIDDLIAFLDRRDHRDRAFHEETVVAYLSDYQRRQAPAAATYYRRFTLLRRFFRWLSRRSGVPDPFLELEPPGKPQQEADWLTPEEFQRLLDAAARPKRTLPGLVERDQFVLRVLVTTGLRRAELLALNWGDLELDGDRPSALIRHGKGNKARRQPLTRQLVSTLRKRRAALQPQPSEPVICGLAGKRLTVSVLCTIVRRAAERASLDGKHVTPHTLRHTAATWLRQQTGDARLVAAYLGHADLSTVSRYAHVAPDELHDAAAAIARNGALEPGLSRPSGRAIVDAATRREAGTARQRRERRAPAPSGSIETADVGG